MKKWIFGYDNKTIKKNITSRSESKLFVNYKLISPWAHRTWD